MARRLIGAVVLLVALAGCGGDPKANPPPSPSPSTTPVSTTPSAPAMPDAAKENSKAGAIAFVRHYVELLNHLEATGDEAPMLAVSGPSCRSCASVAHAANKIYDAGGHVEGGVWSITDAVVQHPAPAAWTVRIKGEIAPSTVVSGGSEPTRHGTGGPANAEFVLTFDSTWKVAQWQTG